MTEADVECVSQLLRESYQFLASLEGLSPEQTRFLITKRGSVDCVRRESQSQRYLVARDGGRIVGMVSVSGDTVTKLYVSPDRSREGIGRLLYEAAESAVRANGHARVTLGAFPSAVPFYTRMGLSVTGRKSATGVLSGLYITLMEKRLQPEAG